MEIAVLIASLILLGITSFYAWFTYRILRETRQEGAAYRSMIEKQLKLSAFPHIYCDIQPGAPLKLEVYNVGSIPAYDIHINVISAYTEESLDIPSFMRTYVQPRYRKYPLQPDKVGYYGIRSSIRHPMLPFQKRLQVPLNIPAQSVDIYVLVQYREVLGSNYFQIYCFSELDEKGSYRANIVEPLKAEPLDRVHFHDMEDAKLTSDKPLPYTVRDFIDLWNHSLSYRLTVLNTEDNPQPQELQDS